MNPNVLIAAITASGSIAIAVTALVLSYRGFASLERRMDRLEDRQARFEQKVDSKFETLTARMDAKLDLLTGKVVEIDNRLTRVEERLKI